jgi:hypothetical protein
MYVVIVAIPKQLCKKITLKIQFIKYPNTNAIGLNQLELHFHWFLFRKYMKTG